MDTHDGIAGVGERWARLRFTVVGRLLVHPPGRGELTHALRELSEQQWPHPSSGEPVRFGYSTVERWYYEARSAANPVKALERSQRSDAGKRRVMSDEAMQKLHAQWKEYPSWTYQLHADNLAAVIRADQSLGPVPSYTTVRRVMQEQGWRRRPRLRRGATEAQKRAQVRLEEREVRSFESAFVHALWHLDFHTGSMRVLTEQGRWVEAKLMAVMDDCSRVICHAQWYTEETARALVHALCQAFAKRGLPRGLMLDNGAAMRAEETQEGLLGLGIAAQYILAYSPHQNGKVEHFWTRVEGRLLNMLRRHEQLTLDTLNDATQAWVELEYNRSQHSELGVEPIERLLAGPSVARPCPGRDELRWVFTRKARRTQRQSDGTVSINGVRYEVPSRLRTLRRLWVRWVRWDPSEAYVVDANDHRQKLARLVPLDKLRNADGRRRVHESATPDEEAEAEAAAPSEPIAPLLRELMARYAATGMPPAYVPLQSAKPDASQSATAAAPGAQGGDDA